MPRLRVGATEGSGTTAASGASSSRGLPARAVKPASRTRTTPVSGVIASNGAAGSGDELGISLDDGHRVGREFEPGPSGAGGEACVSCVSGHRNLTNSRHLSTRSALAPVSWILMKGEQRRLWALWETAFFAVSKLPGGAFFASLGSGGVHGPGAGGRHGVRIA